MQSSFIEVLRLKSGLLFIMWIISTIGCSCYIFSSVICITLCWNCTCFCSIIVWWLHKKSSHIAPQSAHFIHPVCSVWWWQTGHHRFTYKVQRHSGGSFSWLRERSCVIAACVCVCVLSCTAVLLSTQARGSCTTGSVQRWREAGDRERTGTSRIQ